MSNIPKIIHYCWVGGAPKPPSVLYCIESWKKYCPDYEIIEWNESNYDFSKNKYMKQAYEAQKWGFVPDYARLDIVYEHGGIYLDTDVELLKSFDELIMQKAFMGFENTGDGEFFVNCGHGFGAVPHHEIIKNARDLYEHVQFLCEDGTLNMIPSPFYTTQTLRKYGLIQKNMEQNLPGMVVYSSEILCPKNFRTGKIQTTAKTVSIHHFTASWLDDRIRAEMQHQKKVNSIFGRRIGCYILVAESVWKKYSGIELITILPIKILKKVKRKTVELLEWIPYYKGIKRAQKSHDGKEKPIILDTAMESDNVGDAIIMENCMKHIASFVDVAGIKHIPTHRFISDDEKNMLESAEYKILCGTNILSGTMRKYGLWRLDANIKPYCNTILMGVGFDSSSQYIDRYSKKLFQTILSKKYYHSVRDSFSKNKLRSMGIDNVINTGCPTMWGLTEEHCKEIPHEKSGNVVCTVTDYSRNVDLDKKMIEILVSCYDEVYLWLQGKDDMQYVKSLGVEHMLTIVPSDLDAFDNLLKNKCVDYVGTRLHAGIRALSFKRRSIVISIDNRAESIAADTGLPIIKREDVPIYLKERIESKFETKIQLPIDNIEKWKSQFSKNV